MVARSVPVILGFLSLVLAVAINCTGTSNKFGMVKAEIGNIDVYVGPWLGKLDGSSDDDPQPVYCEQDQNSDDNNCVIERVNYDSDCCKSFADRCKTLKGLSVLAAVAALASLGAGYCSKILGIVTAFLTAACFLVIVSIYGSYLNGEYWDTKPVTVNKDANCGFKGYTSGTTEIDYEFDVGMGLCIVGFLLSSVQMCAFCCIDSDELTA